MQLIVVVDVDIVTIKPFYEVGLEDLIPIHYIINNLYFVNIKI